MLKKLLLFLLVSAPAFAACVQNAPLVWTSDLDRASLITCMNNAGAGATINVNSGAQTWTTALSIPGKKLTIKGAGIGQSIVTCTTKCVDGTGASAVNFLDFGGFTFTGTNANGVIELEGTMFDLAFHLHHISLTANNGRGVVIDFMYGLVDHVTVFQSGSGCQSFTTAGSSDSNATQTNPWLRPSVLGTINAVYYEDNVVNWSCGADTVLDAYGGARFAWRHNTVNSSSSTSNDLGGCHGTDSGGRWGGCITVEIYQNIFNNPSGPQQRAGTLRSAVGVWWGNRFFPDSGYGGLTLMIYRACDSLDHSNWLQCNGTNYNVKGNNPASVWAATPTLTKSGSNCGSDGSGSVCGICSLNREIRCVNDAACSGGNGTCSTFFDGQGNQGYPCRNQVGWGVGQTLQPWYGWDNGPHSIGFYDGGSVCSHNCDPQGNNPGTGTSGCTAGKDWNMAPWLQENREFINSGTTPMPGYVPFQYPHPFQGTITQVSDSTASPTPGTYASPQSVSFSNTTPGSTQCVTSDGTTPVSDGNGNCVHGFIYTTPLLTSVNTVYKVLGSKAGSTDSNTVTFTYTFVGPAGTFFVNKAVSPGCSNTAGQDGSSAHPWCDIPYALTRITGGSTITVKAGTYAGGFTITGPSGTSTQHTVIQVATGETVILDNASINSGRIKITGGCSWMEFNGFTITNHNQGLYLDDDAGTSTACTNVSVDHITVFGVGQEGIAVRAGATGAATRNFLITNCVIHDTGLLAPAQNGEGIYMGASSGTDTTNGVTVRGCTIFNTSAECIELKGDTHDDMVDGNDLSGCITSNSQFGNNGSAIEVDEPRNTATNPNHIIKNNIIHDMPNVAGIGKHGIRLGTGSLAFNNLLYNIGNNYQCITANTANFPRVIYNNTVDCSTANAIITTGTTSDVQNNIGPPSSGNNLAISSSYFANYAGHDYHLVSGAAPVAAGANLIATVPTDITGLTRTVPMDIGAYKFTGGTPPAAPTGLTATVH